MVDAAPNTQHTQHTQRKNTSSTRTVVERVGGDGVLVRDAPLGQHDALDAGAVAVLLLKRDEAAVQRRRLGLGQVVERVPICLVLVCCFVLFVF